GNAALRGRRDNRTERFSADGESHQTGGGGRRRSGRRSARTLLHIPGILGAALKPNIALRERAHAQLCEQDRARLLQPLDDRRVVIENLILVRVGAPSRRDSFGSEEV